MRVTRELVAEKLIAYLDSRLTLVELADWAEVMMNYGEFTKTNSSRRLREIVAHVMSADVKTFGLHWQDHVEMLQRLGYQVQVVVQPND